MGILDELNPVKIGKKVVGAVKKQVSKVAKGVKKAVNLVKKIQKKTFKGVKELTRNKYVRLGLMITAAVMLPGAIAALPALSGLGVTAAAVATGAISGAVMGAGGVVLAGGSFKDALKAGAFGAATGAAFSAIGSKIKQAQAAAQGGESLDLTQGKLDAAGELAEVAPTVDIPDPLDLGDPTSGLNENIAKLASDTPKALSANIEPINRVAPSIVDTTKTTVGEAIADRFTAEEVVDGVFDFGTGVLSSAGERFIADKFTDDPIQSGIPAQAQQFGAGMASQAIQFPVMAAEIDPLAAYQNLTYGSGDMNAIGGELLRQPILTI